MATIGRVLLIPKGDYSGSATYNQLDWVRYGGKAWVCKVDGTVNVTPVQGANWQLLAQDGSGGGGGASDWDDISYKPFDTIDTTTDFTVDNLDNNKLHIKRDTFGTVRVVSGGTTTNLEASGDSTIEIDAGTNVTIAADDSSNPKKLTINSTGGGGGTTYTAGNGIDSTELANDKIQLDYGTVAQSNTTKPVTGKAVDDALDGWTSAVTAQTVGDDIVAVFDDLDNSFGYDLYCLDEFITYTDVTKGVGTHSGIKLTYTLDGATSGVSQLYLRILK